MWFKRKLDMLGAAYFRGSLTPTLESLTGLTAHGVSVTPRPVDSDALWEAELEHPEWGRAILRAPREPLPIPDPAIQFDARLGEEDKALAREVQRALLLQVT